MKKLISVFLLLSITLVSYSEGIRDYFYSPLDRILKYEQDNTVSGGAVLTEYLTVNPDTQASDDGGTMLMVTKATPIGKVTDLYIIYENRIELGLTRNIYGKVTRYDSRPVVLQPEGSEWVELTEDENEYYKYRSRSSEIVIGTTNYNDCILIEKDIFLRDTLYMSEYRYYAKDIGLVAYYTVGKDGAKGNIKELVEIIN